MSKAASNKNRQLLILRHGKSDWCTDTGDFYRPLKKRGVESAKNIGYWLNNQQLIPDIIITSPAIRALTTSQYVATAIGITDIEQDASIYEASLSQLLRLLADISNEYKTTMIVGHNPGFEELLLHLCEVDEVFYKGYKLMVTASLAIINMPDNWQRLDRHCSELVDLVRGGDL